jgi:hypothetical protein
MPRNTAVKTTPGPFIVSFLFLLHGNALQRARRLAYDRHCAVVGKGFQNPGGVPKASTPPECKESHGDGDSRARFRP